MKRAMGRPSFDNSLPAAPVWAQQKIEQIVARVNSDIILKSEVDRELDLRRNRNGPTGRGCRPDQPGAG